MKTVTIRTKAFSGGKIELVRCSVDGDGTVLVYDSVAGHYTRCHSLSERAKIRARKLAASR